MTRRKFLKIGGIAAGACVLPVASRAFAGLVDSAVSLGEARVGVLLPQSKTCPLMSENFIEGMRLYFGRKESVCSVRLFSVKDVSLPLKGYKALIEEKKVDLVTGIINSSAASIFRTIGTDKNIPLLAANVGECMPRKGERDSRLFHCTLGHWQSQWAMGKWAAEKLGKRAFIASSLYDSGYDGLYAFRLGFEFGEGRITGTHISHGGRDEGGSAGVISEIRRYSPEVVYAMYSGREASAFINAWSSSGLSDGIQLTGTPFLVDESVLSVAGAKAVRIKSCTSWTVALNTKENSEFVKAFRNRTGRTPDRFGVLGYETAGLIASALVRGGKSGFADSLSNAEFSGPRGSIIMEPKTNSVAGDLFICETRVGGGIVDTEVISGAESVSELDTRMRSLRVSVRSGWNTPYFCV